jgi:hydroxyacylglutathione hydrolase
MLSILSFRLGIVQTNTYLVADPETNDAVVIDPADNGLYIVSEAQKRDWRIGSIWLTHAHFDHLAGVKGIIDNLTPQPKVALHPDDFPLWRLQGGAGYFGISIEPGPEPTVQLHHGQKIFIGTNLFEVRHCPGHSPGHVVFYCEKEKVVFCGDVIFSGSIGRTDLPGGDYETLLDSIRTQILNLPDETKLLPGHEAVTSVGRERKSNPFLI